MDNEYEKLLHQYKDVSDSRLKEIVSSKGYTKDARRAALDTIIERGVIIKMEEDSNFDSEEIEEKAEKSGSTVGEIIKGIAWLTLINSVIICIICFFILNIKYKIFPCIIGVYAGFIQFLFMYAVGEICCLLADIKENTKR